MTGGVWPHCVFQCVDFTVERLNLPPGFVGLLLGLSQGISIALCRLSQVSKLQEQRRKRTRVKMRLHVLV